MKPRNNEPLRCYRHTNPGYMKPSRTRVGISMLNCRFKDALPRNQRPGSSRAFSSSGACRILPAGTPALQVPPFRFEAGILSISGACSFPQFAAAVSHPSAVIRATACNCCAPSNTAASKDFDDSSTATLTRRCNTTASVRLSRREEHHRNFPSSPSSHRLLFKAYKKAHSPAFAIIHTPFFSCIRV